VAGEEFRPLQADLPLGVVGWGAAALRAEWQVTLRDHLPHQKRAGFNWAGVARLHGWGGPRHPWRNQLFLSDIL
jgi:hypothetical protein